jgi:hypothetical protein
VLGTADNPGAAVSTWSQNADVGTTALRPAG